MSRLVNIRDNFMHIKKGDTVKIIAGKDRGRSGKVISVFLKSGRIMVEGVNVYKKHSRPKRQGEKGEVVQVPRPLDASNAMILCGSCKKPARVGYRTERGTKFRYCKKCKSST